MRVLKQGKFNKKDMSVINFICNICDAVFEASDKECETIIEEDNGLLSCYIKCPCCQKVTKQTIIP